MNGTVSVDGGYRRESSHTDKQTLERRDENQDEMTKTRAEGQNQTSSQSVTKEQKLNEAISYGKYHLKFSVVLRNRDPTDTLVVENGNKLYAYLIGRDLPRMIKVPYADCNEIRLGYGEKLCEFDYEISDKSLYDALQQLKMKDGLRGLRLKLLSSDFPIFSEKTGKNVIAEQTAWEKGSCFVGIDFGRLAELSPWWVSRWHGEGTEKEGESLTVREALEAVGVTAKKQVKIQNLPTKVFVFLEKGQLAKVANQPLLKENDGKYRMFAILLTDRNGEEEQRLPLTGVMNREIEDYSKISLFDFTLDEFAQNAVLVPTYFDEIKKEIEDYLAENNGDALQFLTKEFDERQREEDDRDLPKDRGTITSTDVERFKFRAEAGVANMQYKLALCLFHGWGIASNQVESVKWYRKAAEQGNAWAQCDLGHCYYNGNYGVTQDYGKAVEWYRKAAEQGNASAQNALGNCYYSGKGVERNFSRAMEWYLKAAK
ncbi:MAG: sel1 repeat family protein [Fibrobacter sp.]|nr:sel1 repeat family protein [Fibrobacter sp.]